MGPRPLGRGNPVAPNAAIWGRGCFNGAATFRSRKCGVSRVVEGLAAVASMGPRPLGRGNVVNNLRGTRAAIELQWGRDL